MVYIESAHRFQGWFQIPSLRDSQSQSLINMTEQYDIDMDADTANINVPDFANGRRGRFIHDFNSVCFKSEHFILFVAFFFFYSR